MARPLILTRDAAGKPTTGSSTVYDSPEWTQTMLLTADTVKAVTVPTLDGTVKLVAYFNFPTGATLLFCPTGAPTLVVPTGTVTLSTNEILIPGTGRTVVGGQSVQLLAVGANLNVAISYYSYIGV